MHENDMRFAIKFCDTCMIWVILFMLFYFLHSTSVLSIHIDVVLTLSISRNTCHKLYESSWVLFFCAYKIIITSWKHGRIIFSISEALTSKQLELHWCILSTNYWCPGAKHQVISIHSADRKHPDNVYGIRRTHYVRLMSIMSGKWLIHST